MNEKPHPMRRRFKVPCAIGLLGFLTGALYFGPFFLDEGDKSSALQPIDLVGDYQAQTLNGIKTLKLLRDATFRQKTAHKNGRFYATSGQWKLTKKADGTQDLLLVGDLSVDESTGNRKSSGAASFPIDNRGGPEHILIDIGESEFYERIKMNSAFHPSRPK